MLNPKLETPPNLNVPFRDLSACLALRELVHLQSVLQHVGFATCCHVVTAVQADHGRCTSATCSSALCSFGGVGGRWVRGGWGVVCFLAFPLYKRKTGAVPVPHVHGGWGAGSDYFYQYECLLYMSYVKINNGHEALDIQFPSST